MLYSCYIFIFSTLISWVRGENALQGFPTFLAPGTGFVEDNYSTDQGSGEGYFKCIMFIAHFIFTVFTSVPPQMIKH